MSSSDSSSRNSCSRLFSYKKDSMIRVFHVYNSVWTPIIGEKLSCMRELSNSQDPFPVAVMKGSIIVGHVPRKISSICSIFIRKGGSITCEVVGQRRYSADLPQVDLEIPCLMNFTGEDELVKKVERLMITADKLILEKHEDLKTTADNNESNNEVPVHSLAEQSSIDQEAAPPAKKQTVGTYD